MSNQLTADMGVAGDQQAVDIQAPSASASFNFSVAKVLAILVILIGHWQEKSVVWILSTLGLFVFAFSSAYFTSRSYGVNIDTRRFWRRKLERLGLRYWVILSFVSVVVLLKGRTLIHWHTLVHYAGLSGVLNWADIPNNSGLGAGLWFFTLLLIFYLSYGTLAKLLAKQGRAAWVAMGAIAAAVYLQEHVNVGHALWLTSLGFVLGVGAGLHHVRIAPVLAAALAAFALGSLVVLNMLDGYHGLNTLLIAAASIAIVLLLEFGTIPKWQPLVRLAKLEDCLLEIFLIHTYLFIQPTGKFGVDFALSLALVLAVALGLHRLSDALAARVFHRPSRA